MKLITTQHFLLKCMGFKYMGLKCVSLIGILFCLTANPVLANGPIGDHVNHLSDNLNKYTEEVSWLIEQVDGIVSRYETGGAKVAGAEAVVDHWEAVDFHGAIESNYVPVYASIWQGLFGVKESIDESAPVAQVRDEQIKLEQALWQALGAVKLAAQYQDQGFQSKPDTQGVDPATSVEALSEIKVRLDRVIAKYAEQLTSESVAIVHDTYLNLFEGVEGELIAQDADLVEDLEKDFNVTLPKALQAGSSVDQVREVVSAMQRKIDRAKSLLEQVKKTKRDVF